MFSLIPPEDQFLIALEVIIAICLGFTYYLSAKIRQKHDKLAEGWVFIVYGLGLVWLHAIFDALDTLDYSNILEEASEDLLKDILNLFDGLTFVIGLTLLAYGIYSIAEHGAQLWELD